MSLASVSRRVAREALLARRVVIRGLWPLYGGLGLLLIAAYLVALARDQRSPADWLYGVAAALAAPALVAGVRLHRPARVGAWLTLAAGIALEALGDLASMVLGAPNGTGPSPSLTSGFHLAGYAALVLGVLRLARGPSRERDRAAWIDALIVAAGAAILAWVLVVDAELGRASANVPATLVALGYPLLDLVLLTVVARLVFGSVERTLSLTLLGLGFVALLAADAAYLQLSLVGAYRSGSPVDLGWLVSYLCWGAAGLHPSMARIGRAAPPGGESPGITTARLLLLSGGALTGPLALAVERLRGEPIEVGPILAGVAVLYLLVLFRVALGLDELQALARARGDLASRLQVQASQDPLTGLANRTLFLRRLEAALERRSDGGQVAVVYLDLDRLKTVNDSLGHAAGDQALTAVAARLRAGLRPADIVARLGGDEFGIVLADLSESDILGAAERINALLAEPVRVGGRTVAISASVGVALASGDVAAQELVRRADQAMYQAKLTGGRSVARYSEALDAAALARLRVEAELREALARDELVLHYQPVVEITSRRIAGLEALVRWRHPDRGLLEPARFIGVAEETGLIVALGRWVLREAVRQARAWQRAGILRNPLLVSINVAARQLADPGFTREVATTIAGSGLGPGRIALELMETDLVRDADGVARSLALLRKAGVRVVLDDFGTAYASMSYLVNFPVDGLKIDRSFVAGLSAGDEPGPTLVRSMLQLANSLGISAVAEGVETAAEAEVLLGFGCVFAQGYLYSRPLPADQIVPLLEAGVVPLGALATPSSGAAEHVDGGACAGRQASSVERGGRMPEEAGACTTQR